MGTELLKHLVEGSYAFLGTVVGAIAAVVAQQFLSNRLLAPVSDRGTTLDGSWIGTLSQPGLTADATARLTAGRKQVTGMVDLHFERNGERHHLALELRGGFLHDRFLKLDYVKDRLGSIQFGCVVIGLSDDGNSLEGKYAGYGSITRSIVSGTILLTRRS